jgi:hypothetical protein
MLGSMRKKFNSLLEIQPLGTIIMVLPMLISALIGLLIVGPTPFIVPLIGYGFLVQLAWILFIFAVDE